MNQAGIMNKAKHTTQGELLGLFTKKSLRYMDLIPRDSIKEKIVYRTARTKARGDAKRASS